jgi:purine-cytosine permease-like protein
MKTSRVFFGLLLTLLGALSLVRYYFPGLLAPVSPTDWGELLVTACLAYGLALLIGRPE